MKFEHHFEKTLWNLRYVVILSVILSILASITLFFIGSWDIIYSIVYQNPLFNPDITNNNDLLFKIISSIDLFLIGIVLLIFGFGVYELFISEIDFAKGKFAECELAASQCAKAKFSEGKFLQSTFAGNVCWISLAKSKLAES